MTLNYRELHSKLGQSTMIVTFYKANGELRPMLCTRNINTAALAYGYMGNRLSAFSARCTESNRNIGVIDLIIGEARCFKMDRVIDVHDLGEVVTMEQFDYVVAKFKEYVDAYKANTAGTGLFDNIDVKTQLGAESVPETVTDNSVGQTYSQEEVNSMFSQSSTDVSIKL